jgi:hypothetical protein
VHEYPEGDQIRFGRGYLYAAEPPRPLQRTFTLKFSGMFYWRDEAGAFSTALNPDTNILTLNQFYDTHLLSARFIYPHEIFGNLVARFSQAFRLPDIVDKHTAFSPIPVEPFELKILEHPE